MLTASTIAEVSINYQPTNGFEHIKYPHSFRTTLIQIGNHSYNALNTAQSCMGTIESRSWEIIKLVNEIKNPILKPLDLLLFKRRFQKIKSAAKVCKDESEIVVKCFKELLELIEEVQLAHEAKNKGRKPAGKKQEELKLKIKKMKDKLERQEEETKERDRCLKEIDDRLRKILKKIPNGWHLFGLEALKAFLLAVRGIVGINISVGDGASQLEGNSGSSIQELTKIKIEYLKQTKQEHERKKEESKNMEEEMRLAMEELNAQFSMSDEATGEDEVYISEILAVGIQSVVLMQKHWREFSNIFKTFNTYIPSDISDDIHNLDKDLASVADKPNTSNQDLLDDIQKDVIQFGQRFHNIGEFAKMYFGISKSCIMPAIGDLNENTIIERQLIPEVRIQLVKSTDEIKKAIENYFSTKHQ